MTEANRDFILHALTTRTPIDYKASLVDAETIRQNSYNLSVSSYVEPEDTREKIDIRELNARITGIVQRQNMLRKQIDEIVADLEAGLE